MKDFLLYLVLIALGFCISCLLILSLDEHIAISQEQDRAYQDYIETMQRN